jgi:serine/threonine-protein kinase RsbW
MMLKIEFDGSFDILQFVQTASDQVCKHVGIDQDVQEAIELAIRESVINAIKHGNRNDARKRVFVEFSTECVRQDTVQLTICVRDEGEGFDPQSIPDPLAEENLLKSSGRGLLLMRSFMDDVEIRNVPEGGVEIRMIKRVRSCGAAGVRAPES